MLDGIKNPAQPGVLLGVDFEKLKNERQLNRTGKIIVTILWLILGISVLIFAINEVPISDNSYDYKSLRVILATSPKYITEHKGPNRLLFTFQQFTTAKFRLIMDGSADKQPFNFVEGDSITVQVLAEEYRRVIEQKGNFFEMLATGNSLRIYGLWKDGKNYVDFQKLKSQIIRGSGKDLVYVLIIIWIGACIKSLYDLIGGNLS